MKDRFDSPWPGPRPFSDQEQSLLFGRDGDLDELAVLLQTKQVIQLSGRSGVGKTSFLQAKLVPVMDEAGLIPLVYRTWGGVGGASGQGADASDLYARAVFEAARDYTIRTGRKLPRLSGVDLLADLKLVTSVPDILGVVVIFDQFEELVRRDARLGRRFLDQVIRVARDAAVKQVISLRTEYAEDLMVLHRKLGNVVRSARLDELTDAAMREVIVKPPLLHGIEVTDGAADLLIGWWKEARDKQASTGLNRGEAADIGHLGASDVGLLHLQAVLWALYRDWASRPRAKAKVLDQADVEAFAQTLGDEGDAGASAGMTEGARHRAVSGAQVIAESLGRWIVEPTTTSSQHPDTVRLIRAAGDLIAGFARNLSAAGYKSAQELTNLALLTIGPDLLRLGVRSDELESALDLLRETLGKPGELTDDEAVSRLLGAGPAVDRLFMAGAWQLSTGRIAGHVYRDFARVREGCRASGREVTVEDHTAALRHAARELLFAFTLALYQLQSRHILTSPPSQTGAKLIELVHDGFGPALTTWAEERLQGPQSAIESIVAINGRDLVWESLSREELPSKEADGLCWVGCWISGQSGGRMPVTAVDFRDCDFTGSAFERVDFHGVTFDDCRLRGVLFRDCTFDDVTFLSVDLSMTTFLEVEAPKVTLQDVTGACIIFDDLGRGTWTFDRANLRQCLFQAPSDGTRSETTAYVRDSIVSHWQVDDGALAALVLEDCGVQFSTSDSSASGPWITMIDCEQVGSNFPPPVVDATAVGELDHGGLGLQDPRPTKLVKNPFGPGHDPWKAGRK